MPLKRYISALSWRQGFPAHFYAIRNPFLRVQVKSYYPLCDRLLNVLKTGRWIGPKCVGWRADLGLSAKVSDRGAM